MVGDGGAERNLHLLALKNVPKSAVSTLEQQGVMAVPRVFTHSYIVSTLRPFVARLVWIADQVRESSWRNLRRSSDISSSEGGSWSETPLSASSRMMAGRERWPLLVKYSNISLGVVPLAMRATSSSRWFIAGLSGH
jgi:hypothetical protein